MANWVMELLVAPVKKVVIHNNNNLRLKKTLLLVSIHLHLSDFNISEPILDSLEIIENLDRNNSIPISHLMKAAYCKVALECTVRYLLPNQHSTTLYSDAVQRIWRDRFQNLEGLNSALLTDDLRHWKQDVEAAAAIFSSHSHDVRNRLIGLNTRNDAFLLTNDYVCEAFDTMGLGPSFLEFIPATDDHPKLDAEPLPSEDQEIQVRQERGLTTESKKGNTNPSPQGSACRPDAVTTGIEIQRKTTHQNCKPVADHQRAKASTRITDYFNPESEVAPRRYNTLPTSTEKLKPKLRQERHICSSEDLQAAEGSSHHDVNVIPELGRKHSMQVKKLNKIDLDASDSSTNAVNSKMEHQRASVNSLKSVKRRALHGLEDDATAPSSMVPNSIARAFAWDYSIDYLRKEKGRLSNGLEHSNFSKRRKQSRWSVEEEIALRAGVKKYGEGRWKQILKSKDNIFNNRTEVDLKDKWRNLTK